MLQILKYPAGDGAIVKVPKGSQFLDVQYQGGRPRSWWLCPIGVAEEESHQFHIFGTGWEIPAAVASHYLCTRHTESLVWHFFKVPI